MSTIATKASTMSKERMYQVIRAPLITEKATLLSEKNQFVFKVSDDATKPEIKIAIETLFKVKVTAVNTLITKGKTKRFKGRPGVRSDVKKAFVTLAEGQSIDFTTGLA
ncbi:MAG: 50S ribosomal protein L23 [Acidocella sp. 35-58-6]|jgi:large subunit ribosomal protein L23|nr:MAG: 50S ribosomal protein L23 [Acidocella sp. 20-58-15]OYY04442.1 MAG: 50S ribosomal protein L23 [Acidocella sp. 35-58-6]